MSEAPSNELIEARRRLTKALDKTRDALAEASSAMQTAKAAVLEFDAEHPEVMQFLNFVVGEHNRAKGDDDAA